MSNFLAFATVTATLRRYLQATLPEDVTGSNASSLSPGDPAMPSLGVNLFLYQATPNTAWQNADLPTRSARGELNRRPRAAFDLRYVLSFLGDDGQLQPQRIMGSVVRSLNERPVLTRAMVESTVSDPTFDYLAASDLAAEVERVQLSPVTLSLDELSKLWSSLFQTPYVLSMVYSAAVVLIESGGTPRRVLPVRSRMVAAEPFQRPVIDDVVSEIADEAPVQMEHTVVIRGSRLGSPVHHVRVGPADLQPVENSVEGTSIRVTLTGPGLRAGVWGVQVVYRNGTVSNAAALVVRPRITIAQGGVSGASVPVTFNPPVGRRQRVMLFLNELGAPAGRTPDSWSFEAPVENGIGAGEDETSEIAFPISGVQPGHYLVRAQVDGAESVLEVDAAGRYAAPDLTVP